MHETNRTFQQTPPPHFYLKVVCKKGGVFSGAYGIFVNTFTSLLIKDGSAVGFSFGVRAQTDIVLKVCIC